MNQDFNAIFWKLGYLVQLLKESQTEETKQTTLLKRLYISLKINNCIFQITTNFEKMPLSTGKLNSSSLNKTTTGSLESKSNPKSMLVTSSKKPIGGSNCYAFSSSSSLKSSSNKGLSGLNLVLGKK